MVTVYWTIIHDKTIPKHRADGPWTKVLCQYMVHTVPAIACLLNSAITNCVLSRRMLSSIMYIGSAYITINFLVVKFWRNGVPLYDFMHWRSMETTLVAAIILVGFSVVYLVFCLIDEQIKPALVKLRNKKLNNLMFKSSSSEDQVIFDDDFIEQI